MKPENPSPDDELLEALLTAFEDDLEVVGYHSDKKVFLDELGLPQSLLAIKEHVEKSNCHLQIHGHSMREAWTPYYRDVQYREWFHGKLALVQTARGWICIKRTRF